MLDPVFFEISADIPRYVEHKHFPSKLYDKSGYDHVRLTQESRKYFGFYWQGWYFVYNIIPFGWSPSAYIYQTIGLGATNFIHSKGVSLLQYINDHPIGQLKSNKGQNGLSYLGPKIWNNLHSDLKSAESVNSFKHKIKNKFFKDLQNQEDNPYEYY